MSPQSTDPAHAFDFWVGEWDVFGPQGGQVGTNSIKALFGPGCSPSTGTATEASRVAA
jgi:hypothetical protein